MTVKQKKKLARAGILAGRYAIVLLWLCVSLLPLYVAVVTSLTPFNKLGQPFILPKYFRWQNYVDVFEQTPIWGYLRSSFVYALGVSLISVVFGVLAAYALSRFHFKGKTAFATVLVAIQVIPQIVIAMPLFTMANALGVYDTYWAVIFAMVATAMAYPILLLKGFFDGIPPSLEEAAVVDGCTRTGALVRVILPITLPAIVTAFALSFFSGWDAYLYPIVMTSSPEMVPMTVGMSRMVDIVTPWDWIMAGTVIGILPPIVVYFIAQKYLIGGLTAGSDK